MSDTIYQHLLLALDFNADEQPLIDRARALRDRLQARLSLVHVLDPVPANADYAGGAFVAEPLVPESVELDQVLMDAAHERLDEIAKRLGVSAEDAVLEIGSPAESIARVAHDKGADLILIGAHQHHWFGRLLGSTSKSVLGRLDCDLLVVRIGDDD